MLYAIFIKCNCTLLLGSYFIDMLRSSFKCYVFIIPFLSAFFYYAMSQHNRNIITINKNIFSNINVKMFNIIIIIIIHYVHKFLVWVFILFLTAKWHTAQHTIVHEEKYFHELPST